MKLYKGITGLTLTPMLLIGLAAAQPAVAQTYNFVAGVPVNKIPGRSTTTNLLYTGPGVLGNYGAATSVFNFVDYNGTGNQNSKVNGGGVGSTGVDSNGNASTVTITYGADGQFEPNPGFTSDSTSPISLLQNFAHVNKGNGAVPAADNITLGGLAPNTPYTIVFYATNGQFGTGGANQFSILDAANGTALTSGVTSGDPAGFTGTNATTTFIPGVNYVTLAGITSASGNVFASYNATTGGEGDFNGLQIQLAPEPSQALSLSIAALALGGLMLKARKRQMV